MIFRKIRKFFAWKLSHQTFCWLYEVNVITGDRRAIWLGNGYSACDIKWLKNATGNGYMYGPIYNTTYED